jgi:hypothetical protein
MLTRISVFSSGNKQWAQQVHYCCTLHTAKLAGVQ